MNDFKYPLSKVKYTQEEIEWLQQGLGDILVKGRLTQGDCLRQFEENFAEYTDHSHAVAVNSGTSGLIAALLAIGVGPNDKVIVPSFTFIATVNAIISVGAIPLFVDLQTPFEINEQDASNIFDKELRVKAIITVSLFGKPTNTKRICALAKAYNAKVIEDACEALGVYEDTGGSYQHVGHYADIAVFGFYPNKLITTGEGGMVVTNNNVYYNKLRTIRNQGNGYTLGFNFRMSELNALLGVYELQDRIDRNRKDRQRIVQEYIKHLEPSVVTHPYYKKEFIKHYAPFTMPVLTNLESYETDRVHRKLATKGVETRRFFQPTHLHGHVIKYLYEHTNQVYSQKLEITEHLSATILNLPLYPGMTSEDVKEIVKLLHETIKEVEEH